MRTLLKHAAGLILVLAGTQLIAPARAAEASDVLSPNKRQAALDQAKNLLTPRREALPEAIDPFHPEAFSELVAASDHGSGATAAGSQIPGAQRAAAAGLRSPQDLLQAIAAGLQPSGFIVIGGQPTLVFGQKRVKAGGVVTITFEGTEYTLEITSIDRPNFTLRLNSEVFTRPIK